MANRSCLLSPDGAVVARYDKIHMFDATLPSGKVIRESSAYRPGAQAVIADLPWGRSHDVCYDLRFPQLYRTLAKAGAIFMASIVIPARNRRRAWHTLLRARAIETELRVRAGDVR